MTFTDPAFLFFFLPATLAVFYAVLSLWGTKEGLTVLFGSSIIFYLSYGVFPTVLLIAALFVNFGVAVLLVRSGDDHPRRRLLYGLGQTYNLVTLCYFKYKILTLVLGSEGGLLIDVAGLAIPAGISFYTFHQAVFLADAYARERNVVEFLDEVRTASGSIWTFCHYGAFVSFFPQLIIGPITYLHEFHPQVKSRGFARFDPVDLAVGLGFVTIGMFKKLVVADNLAPTVEVVFQAAEGGAVIHPLYAWVGALAYMAQLYFDFSGYSDMAIGLARMFGLRYPINFYSPFKATGIIDYYRRWHMTLTRVIARFLYTPLSLAGTRYGVRNRLTPLPRHLLSLWLPLIVNFQIIGLWHDALWTFAVFGLMHGVWYAAEAEVRATRWYKGKRKTAPPLLRGFVERGVFSVLLCLSLAMFRSESVGAGFHLYAQMFGAAPGAAPSFDLAYPLFVVLCAFSIIYLLPNSVELMGRFRPAIMTYDNQSYAPAFMRNVWRPTWGWAAFAAGLTVASLYYVSRQPPFLYQGF